MNTCQICKTTDKHQCYAVREMMLGLREVHQYFECSSCGCLQITAAPADISRFYPKDYYSFNKKKSTVLDWIIGKRNRYALSKKGVLGQLLSLFFPNPAIESIAKLKPKQNARILDVGSGAGKLVTFLVEEGWENVMGIDPFISSDIANENGVLVQKKSIQEAEGLWDIVMFHHSFEHIWEQKEALVSATRLMEANGNCIIRVPTASSWAWKNYREHWVALDSPRHFFLHTIESMRQQAVKAGLNLDQYYYDSTDVQFWASVQYQNDIPLFSPQSVVVNKIKYALYFPRTLVQKYKSAKLNRENRGDHICFFLSKP